MKTNLPYTNILCSLAGPGRMAFPKFMKTYNLKLVSIFSQYAELFKHTLHPDIPSLKNPVDTGFVRFRQYIVICSILLQATVSINHPKHEQSSIKGSGRRPAETPKRTGSFHECPSNHGLCIQGMSVTAPCPRI